MLFKSLLLLVCCVYVRAFVPPETSCSDMGIASIDTVRSISGVWSWSNKEHQSSPPREWQGATETSQSEESQVRNLWSPDNLPVPSAQVSGAFNVGRVLFEASCSMSLEELFDEWDKMEEASWALPLCGPQNDENAGQVVVSGQSPGGLGVGKGVGHPKGDHVEDAEEAPGVVVFVRPTTPEDFVGLWPRQKLLAQSLRYPLTPAQKRMLWSAYYTFAPAGRLLEELGEEVFLQRFGGELVGQMQSAAAAEIRQRKVVERERREAENGRNVKEEKAVDMTLFVWPKSPVDFVQCWPEQKRLFESLSRPYSSEQRHILSSTYYRLTRAGQLLEELGGEEFLQRYGKSSVNQMIKTTTKESQKRKMAEKERDVAEAVKETEDGKASGAVAFVRPKSPKGFVKRWLGQKRLYESLPRPLNTEQARILKIRYTPFTAAGQLLEALGERAFLKQYGQGTVKQMEKATAAEVRQRKMTEEECKAKDLAVKGADASIGIVKFMKPKSVRDFVEHWPEQKRLFESLRRPLTFEQKSQVRGIYYKFAAAGQLLDDIGKGEFLKRFEGGSVTKMQRDAVAEMKERKAVGQDLDVVEAAEETARVTAPGFVKFAKFASPKDFVERWPEQERLFASLLRPCSPEQTRELDRTFYSFKAAGQLLEKLGEEVFLRKFGKGSAYQMQKNTIAEMAKRKKAEEDREAAETVEEIAHGGASGIVVFKRARTPQDFVKRWAEQKRLWKSLPHPISPEQRHMLKNTCYAFASAGQLLEELGEQLFLQRFGVGSVEEMRKATAAEMRQRRAAEDEQGVSSGTDAVENGGSGIVRFVKPKSPKDFVKLWPEQKRLFESLSRPFSPEQGLVLDRAYYGFTTAGRLLEELGEKAFLQRFGDGSLTTMESTIRTELKQRRVNEKGGKSAARESVETKGKSRAGSTDKPTKGTSREHDASAKGRKQSARRSKRQELGSDGPEDG